MTKCHKCGTERIIAFEDYIITIAFLIFVFTFSYLLCAYGFITNTFYETFGFWNFELVVGLFEIMMYGSFAICLIGAFLSRFD